MKAATFRHTSAAGGMLVPCQVRGFIAANQGGTAESKIFRPWSMFIDQGFFCASMSHTAQIPKRYKAESAPANCCRFAEDFMRQQPEQRGGSRSFNTRVNAVQHPLRKTRERAFEKRNQRHLQLEFRPYAYQQEILDNLEAEREVHGHYNNLVVAATGAHTIILTSQKDTEIRILRTCLFFWPAAGSG